MIPLRPSSPTLLAASLAVLATAACREDASLETTPPEIPGLQGAQGFFDPQPGESWTYAVTRDFAPGSRLPSAKEADATELPNGVKRLTFECRRICAGTEQPDGAEKELTAFTLYEDDRLVEREFYDITSAGMIARGWTPAPESTPTINPPATGVLLNPGVKIALPGMTGGLSWSAPGTKSGPLFHLDIIERTTVKVPAGEFDASRIRLTSTSPKRATKRTVWFAENVGIVKEEIIRYGQERILVKEELVLTKWTHPADDLPTPEPGPASESSEDDNPADDADPDSESSDPEDPDPDLGDEAPTGDPADNPSADPPGESGDSEPSDEGDNPEETAMDDKPGEASDEEDQPTDADDDTNDQDADTPPATEDPPPPKALIIEE